MPKGTIGALCSCPTLPNSISNSQCNTTLNLACFVSTTDAANCAVGNVGSGTVFTTIKCDCAVYSNTPTTVTTSTYNRCDCKDNTYYWDG